MKVKYALLSLVLIATQIQAQGISYNEESVDLDALYEQIDDAITQSPLYVAERERKIAVCRDSLQLDDNLEKRVKMAENLLRWDVLTSLGVIVRCLPYSARTRIWWQSR